MGKKLIIKGADFSANAVEVDKSWVTVLSGEYAYTEGSGSKYYRPELPSVLPSGTNTKVTIIATGTSGVKVAIGALDTEGESHNNFWAGSSPSVPVNRTYEKELDFDMDKFEFWFQNSGVTLEYILEAWL